MNSLWTTRIGILALAAFALIVVAAGAPARAGSDLIGEVILFGEEELQVRAATKTEMPISKVPGSVTVIGAEQIKASGARTIPELLRQVAGVNVRWNPMVQTLDMRSFGQNPFTSRVLLLIDGVPYNSWNKGGFPQHPGFDFFLLRSIKRLEIVRGPGSALYGENAFWGVVNIVTLSGEDLEGGKVEMSVGDLRDQSLGLVYGKSAGEGSFLVSGRIQRGQLPVGFWSEGADSEVRGSDVYLKGKLRDFELSYYRHDDEMDGFSSPGFVPGTTFHSAEQISQTVDILAGKYSREWDGFSFSSDVSFAQRDGSRCAACHAAPQNPDFEGTVDHGSQLIGDFRVGITKLFRHDILIGVEGRRVDTGDHVDELISPAATTSDVVFDYTKVAAYAQDQVSFADDRFRLTLGARFDGANDLFDSELSPRVAFVYSPIRRWVVRGGWSQAFRFPNFSELYQSSFFLSLDGGGFVVPITVFQPNPELRPEQISTFELGTEVRISSAVSAKLDLFASEVEDFIVLAFIGGGPTRLQFENHPDDARILGSELEVRWRPSSRFTGLVNWTWQDNEADGKGLAADGRPIEFVYSPANKLNLAAYLGPFKGFRIAVEAQWRDERQGPSAWNFADRTSTATLASYTMLNVKLSYDAPIRLGRSDEALRFSLYGKNLLDERIEETFLPIDMELPGDTLYGTVELSF